MSLIKETPQEVLNFRLPVNHIPAWNHLFKIDDRYLRVKLKVRHLKNAFVSEDGLVIKNGLLAKGSAPNLGFSSYDSSHYFSHWRTGLEQALVSKLGRSLKRRKLDVNKQYLLVHSPWFSYYFWITECLPRILAVKDQHSDLHLIYPEVWHTIPYVRESLELFPDLRREVIPNHYHIEVPQLVMPEVKPWTPMFIPEQTQAVRALLLKWAEDTPSQFGTKIYLSRERAARKRFSNEAQAEKTLSELGFDTVFLEELPFKSQIATLRDARELVGITGAGTINAMFMPQEATLYDITNQDYLHRKQYKFHFFKMCNMLNIRYAVLFAQPERDPLVDHYSKQNLIFDPEAFSTMYKQVSQL
jgi:hypothetical protein